MSVQYLPDGSPVLAVGDAGVAEHDGSALAEVFRLTPTEVVESSSLSDSKPVAAVEEPEAQPTASADAARIAELEAQLAEAQATDKDKS